MVRDQVRNVLDYLTDAELALFSNAVNITSTRVSFHSHDTTAAFLLNHDHPSLEQYLRWIAAGAYSAFLLDGAQPRISYTVEAGTIAGHRLAYVPCPYDLDPTLLATGEPLDQVIDCYRDTQPALRSPVRFDFDPRAAGPGHPAVYLTINGSGCRIACVAPVDVLRFTDFVFRHFYPALWAAHRPFFAAAASRDVGRAGAGR